ncbi:ornithine cyclodeaminase family protein [Sulfobacillus harzensis]|uniref:Ornithine cyclodeaminase family protein n=1 Tax=Sulfobacillus harzensis TaxID=2729629 RepID=A0A7Y0L6K9_9FIRM|nr:ornithine cyclodeaminase family protein [Sulfobacillus harzensis]NMP23385.1 ornithine cyclodeaminase family protein [Sulfobacillus harzensis]
MRILTDADIRAVCPMADAVAFMKRVFYARSQGELVSAPREGFRAGPVGLVWTPGALRSSKALGLRVYLTGLAASDQLAAAWDGQSGELIALAVGSYLGQLRTGAIGGVAIDLLARPDAETVGVIGFGRQAWMQVEAALAVRPIRRVIAYRRDLERLRTLVDEARMAWSVEVIAAHSAIDAVSQADILVTATGSSVPVFDPAWLRPGTHINALGPKYRERTELAENTAALARILASDFPEQHRKDSDFLWHRTEHQDRMQDLAGLVASPAPRNHADITLFLSHGLSGTEVALLQEVAGRAEQSHRGIDVTS